MKTGMCFFFSLLFVTCMTWGQRVGDQATAGQNNQRTYLNANAGRIAPPLEHLSTISLPGFTAASTMSIFEDHILVGEGGIPTRYQLIDSRDGTSVWTRQVAGSDSTFNYVPAFSNGVILLGSAATTTVKAIRAVDGTDLWEDISVGETAGRFPVLVERLALYHGQNRLVAADPTTGFPFWDYAKRTARAPISLFGVQAYLMDGTSNLNAIDLRSGNEVWSSPSLGGDGSDLLATASHVFVTNPADSSLASVRTSDGAVVWSTNLSPFGSPGIALAYGKLFTFYSEGGAVRVAALDPENGQLLWESEDPSETAGTPMFAQIADNTVYFYNPGSQRVRALDAFTGNLLWSIHQAGVHGLSAARGKLYVLLDDTIEIYGPGNQVYLAHLADGLGLSTLFVVTNRSNEVANGSLDFYGDEGLPLELVITGTTEPVNSVPFAIPPATSIRIQTADLSAGIVTGWAIVNADQPITASSIYQTSVDGEVLFEAGVGSDTPTGRGSLLVNRITVSSSQFSSGLAMVNPSGEDANISIEFLRVLPTPATASISLLLPTMHHIARFAEEFFPEEAVQGSEGTLVITADVPIVVVALRTQNGFQMSSYPLGRP